MLPDTLHKLPQAERFAYAKILAYMSRIDNELTIEEMAMFEQRLGTALLSPSQRKEVRVSLKSPPPLAESLASLSAEGGRLAFRDAVLMCAADGTVDDDEMEALKELSKLLDLGDDSVSRMLAWVRDGYNWMQAGFELLNEL
ncbi:MAG TPA: TerB family tellurite resistance protein [Candidatus Poseidoniales archaeon]|nr:MAG: hypothetical protein CXX80_11820 [Euryarchaeota archaeon]HIA39797.1 TerB family tellurite resistance protein [Candidatus Poseidoniales archaeon]PXY75092.1 MAG: hypothetical protein CXX80_05415 [Euryarchaeota archaeon]PXY77265.1 MAG: hypothetical protein CXX80_01145 [Euryarchaeota archaeon]HIA90022.1 TerB family tellurite resistance protein [Candidatus Poseidoniales archaeon]